MKVEVWCVGKNSQRYLDEGIQLYKSKLNHYFSFEYIDIIESKAQRSSDKDKSLAHQAEMILKKLSPDDHLILLDEHGKKYTSREFSLLVNKWMVSSYKRVVLLIGGAFGFHHTVVNRAKDKISLSEMTFSHDMVRLFLLEQLYRAGTILKNEPYHND